MSARETHNPLLLPLPPPPPSAPPSQQSPLSPSSPLPSSQRFAAPGSGPLYRHGLVQPPCITTALSTVQTRSVWSASTVDTPGSPYASAALSPISQAPWSNSRTSSPLALRPPTTMLAEYNPQQWGRSGPAGGQYRPHAPVAAPTSGGANGTSDSLPSPPPPYSPPERQDSSMSSRASLHYPNNGLSHLQNVVASPSSSLSAFSSPVTTVAAASPLTPHQRQSSGSMSGQVPYNAAPAFPPPPTVRDRSTSRTREGARALFSLSALRNRSSDRGTTPNAMEALQQSTAEALQRAPVAHPATAGHSAGQRHQVNTGLNRSSMYIPTDLVLSPPAARRSASAGDAGSYGGSSQASSQHGSSTPLPPPPPGPPPNGSRSISHDRGSSSVPILSMPTRRPHHRGTALEPVPPTPAGWSEFPQQVRQASADRARSPLVRLDTDVAPHGRSPQPLGAETGEGSNRRVTEPTSVDLSVANSDISSSFSGGSHGNQSGKGIRERRSESRAAKDRAGQSPHPGVESDSAETVAAKPSNLNLASPDSGGGISRQRAVRRSKPSISPLEARGQPSQPTRRLTDSDAGSTPPISANSDSIQVRKQEQGFGLQRSGHGSLPSPTKAFLKSPIRPISHILHTPNIDPITTPPLIPPPPRNLAEDGLVRESEADAFARSSLQRHQSFIEKERAALSDKERLELFAEFIVTESRLRRDRYSAAFTEMATDVIELTRDLWKTYHPSSTAAIPSARASRRSSAEASSMPRKDSMDSYASSNTPLSSQANFTPMTETESPLDAPGSAGARDGSGWPSYKPVLSPIPSMALSSIQDEEMSRGRPSSRWWESDAGSQSAGGSHRLERSKRESKYMGVSREARFNLQWEDQQSPSHWSNATPRKDEQPVSSEYPPEKVGWHEESKEESHSTSTPRYQQSLYGSIPSTPDPLKLDVSRLITLPPPYPRHYPAMSNSHPDLATVRSSLRSLTDLAEVKATKEAFRKKIHEEREREVGQAAARREEMQYNIQQQLQVGQMTYASAAVAESEFNANEARMKAQTARREFDGCQVEVMSPLNAFLSERITKASACIAQLKAGLNNAAVDPTQSQVQEEGDEQPELLEKLNLLKWLFEARENLHKQLFELEGERNERYRAVITTPMREAGEEDKLADAEKFFRHDREERKANHHKAKLKRFEEFSSCIETHVSRGVEDQLNAFWDIAPGLLAIVQKVPDDLTGFDVLIPPSEYNENPQYHDHPLQYLYSLLEHAEKSAYQFIESQTNLFCLQHEALTAVMAARLRVMEVQRVEEGEDASLVGREMAELRVAEEDRLTSELKEKVSTVESQWREALGNGLLGCKERVARFLEMTGGWDDSLSE